MLVRSTTIKAICIAAFVMMIVSLIFIPNPWCSLWVAFSIISIETGVVGYMTLWNVNLDSISMINLIMCIGFSVDFSAHISYAYLTAKVNSSEERVRECLFTLGLPILQGALSTIIGVSALVFAPSYIFVTFFKTVFLVIFFGAMHGLFLLPVLLSILGPGSTKDKLPPTLDTENKSSVSSPQISIKESPEKKANKFKAEDEDSLDKDMGLGTSEESSSDSSISKATGAITAETIATKTKCDHNISNKIAYSNEAYVDDEMTYTQNKAGRGNKKEIVLNKFQEINSFKRTYSADKRVFKHHRKPTKAESVD